MKGPSPEQTREARQNRKREAQRAERHAEPWEVTAEDIHWTFRGAEKEQPERKTAEYDDAAIPDDDPDYPF